MRANPSGPAAQPPQVERTSPDESERQIRAEAVKLLYKQSRSVFSVSIINASLLVYLLWGVIPEQRLVIWLSLLLMLTAIRALFSIRYMRLKPAMEHNWRWARIYTFGSLLSGCIWGSAGILLYPQGHIEYQALVIFLLGGMGVGAFASHVIYLPAFYSYFVPSMLPVFFNLLSEGDRSHVTLGMWVGAFIVGVLILSRNSNRIQTDALRLRVENQMLITRLEKKREIAEQASIAKSKFLAAASHDLRQPLFALGMFSQTLEEIARDDDIRTISQHIKTTYTSLKNLLDSLLDISKLEAGVVRAEKSDFFLQDLFERLALEFQPVAQAEGIELRVIPTSAVVHSDAAILGRVLRNLVDNAIRYTHDGKIIIGLKHCAGGYQIRVCDSGIGIAAEHHDKIFNEYYQVANIERDAEKGLGLGLAIVKGSVELLGEHISLSSQPGKGTMFCITIARGEQLKPAQIAHNNYSAQEEKIILVIDDDRFVRDGLQHMLETWGFVPLIADSGRGAIEVLENEGLEPDLVLADYRLRDHENGVEAAEVVIARIGRPLPIIIITGDTAPERLREVVAHGHELLHKPIPPQELRAAILLHLGQDEEGN